MKLIKLTFKRVGNHWYLDIPHDNPEDLKLDPRLEYLLNLRDTFKNKVVDIYLCEQTGFIVEEGLIQFSDADLLRYFTTNDSFNMELYIQGHKYSISSKLYFLIEREYKADFHELVYRILSYEV